MSDARGRRPRGGPLDGEKSPLAWIGWPHCDRCFSPLAPGRILAGMRRRERLRYPFTMPDGSRKDLPVRWLCPDCEERADEVRSAREEEVEDDPSRRLSKVIDMGTLGEGYLLESVLAVGERSQEHVDQMERKLRSFARTFGEGDISWARVEGTVRFYTNSRELRDAWASRHDT